MNCNDEKRAFAPMSVETELSLYCALSDLIEKHSYCSPIVSPHLSERLKKYIKENPDKFEKEMSKYNSYSGDTLVEKQIKNKNITNHSYNKCECQKYNVIVMLLLLSLCVLLYIAIRYFSNL